MEQFIKQHSDCTLGVLEGFDRVLFRGTLRSLCYPDGVNKFLAAKGVPFKEFGDFTQGLTDQIAGYARQMAERARRPYHYIKSAKIDKQQIASQIAEADGIQKGLICVPACVEPCYSFEVHRNRQTKQAILVSRERRCRFFYFYFMDREFGLMHVRLQSWIPFHVQVCINGRSYLQRQLDREGIGYIRRGNCFLRIDNVERAQEILDRLHRRRWGKTLDALVRRVNPLLGHDGGLGTRRQYYWTFRQTEVATDVMFRDAETLAAIYPALCRHVIEHFSGEDLLRFFGKKATLHFSGEVITEMQRLVEGVRIRHRLWRNSIKIYDKEGSVLRVETTINNPSPFRVLRKADGDAGSALAWRKMRKGISDTARRVAISIAANRRYLDALAAAGRTLPSHRVLDPVSKPVTKHGSRTRGLRPINPDDAALFQAVLHGEHLIHGFTNGTLQRLLYATPARDARERSRRCSRVGRQLRMLRRHGLIQKVGRRRLYRTTPKGHGVMTLALALRNAAPDLAAA